MIRSSNCKFRGEDVRGLAQSIPSEIINTSSRINTINIHIHCRERDRKAQGGLRLGRRFALFFTIRKKKGF